MSQTTNGDEDMNFSQHFDRFSNVLRNGDLCWQCNSEMTPMSDLTEI